VPSKPPLATMSFSSEKRIECAGVSDYLGAGLFEVIEIEMRVPAKPHKLTQC
jgi:hypothetical protein